MWRNIYAHENESTQEQLGIHALILSTWEKIVMGMEIIRERE